MDKVTPKADIYKANLDRAAPLLEASCAPTASAT